MPTASRLLRALRTRVSRTGPRLALFAALALVAKWPLLSSAAMMNDFRDAQYFTLFEEAARITVTRFHEVPLWNPYYCGGIPALGIPSARFAAPTFLLTLVFGTLRGGALIAFTMSVLGLEGTFRYARARGATALGAVAGAPVFALAGFFARASSLDWINFYGFELVPWAALGIHTALRGSTRGAVVAAVALAWMIGQGGTYAGPFMLLVGACELAEAARRAVARRHRERVRPALRVIAGMATTVVLLALALSAYRLWPVAENLASSPRILGGAPGHTSKALFASLFGESPLGRGEMLVGVLAIPAMLLSLWRPRARPLVLMALLWLWLALGYAPKVSLFALLRQIPPYTMLRYPERFLVLFALAGAVGAAFGVDAILALARRRTRWRVPALLVSGLLLANVALQIRNDHAEARTRSLVPAPVAEAGEFRQARGNRWLAAYYPALGRGSLSCFDDYNVSQSSALRGDLEHEEFLADPAAGTVERERWSPNEIVLRLAVTKPARVVVNQNFHPGWKANVGEVVSDAGRLAVDVPAGSHALVVRFAPRSAQGGAAVSLFAVLAALVLARRARTNDTTVNGTRAWAAQLGIAAAPLLVVPLAMLFVREPPRPPPQLLATPGETLLADAPPPSSRPMGVHFAEGLELEAAAVHPIPGLEPRAVTLELNWRKTGPVSRDLGVFVHVEAEGEGTLGADHVLLGSQLPLEDAPTQRTLRDVTAPIAPPTALGRRHWTVRVGLWHARGRGGRLAVTDPGRASVRDDAVEIGSFDTP